jgi:AcrR family transcriptional regulator
MPSQKDSNRRRRRSPEQQEQRAQRRVELLEAAGRAVRRDGPLVSMSQIAAEAGVTKPILYRHFGDKGGLYQAIAEFYVRTLMDRLRDALQSQTDPQELITATIEAYLAFVESEPQAYRFLMHRAISERPEAQETVQQFIRQVATEVAVILGEELRRLGLDSGGAEPWAHGMVGMVQLAGDWWLENRSMPRQRLVSYLADLLWGGFGSMQAAARPAADAS